VPRQRRRFRALHHPQVQRNETQPTERASLSITVPARMTLLFAVGHLHTGGLNISLSLNGQAVCTSFPTYGTELGVAGNEKVPPVCPRSTARVE